MFTILNVIFYFLFIVEFRLDSVCNDSFSLDIWMTKEVERRLITINRLPHVADRQMAQQCCRHPL